MILGIATEKHRRNRRHFQQLVIVKHGVTTTKCHSVENVPRHEPRLQGKRKKNNPQVYFDIYAFLLYIDSSTLMNFLCTGHKSFVSH